MEIISIILEVLELLLTAFAIGIAVGESRNK